MSRLKDGVKRDQKHMILVIWDEKGGVRRKIILIERE